MCHIERGITQVTPSNAMLTGQIPVRRALPDLSLQLTCYLQLFVCVASAGLALESCLPSLHHHSDCAICLLYKKKKPKKTALVPLLLCSAVFCSAPNHLLRSICSELLFSVDRARLGKQILNPKTPLYCFSIVVIKVCLLYCS